MGPQAVIRVLILLLAVNLICPWSICRPLPPPIEDDGGNTMGGK